MDTLVIKIGLRLKELRGDRSLEDVARVTGISKSLLSKYERGVTEPGSSALAKLARFHNVSLDYILGFTDDPRPIVLKTNLSPETKENILNYIEYLEHRERE